MANFIDEGFCDKDDPIFTEGITGFSIRKQPTTLSEAMRAANWHEVGVTLRLEPDSAKQEFLASFRKGQNGEELPEGAEQYAQYMRSLHQGQQ